MKEDFDVLGETAAALFEKFGQRRHLTPSEQTLSLWRMLDEHGMTRVSAPGPIGADQDLRFLAAILRAAGRAAVSIPLLETHIAGTLLNAAHCADAGGAATVAIDTRLLFGSPVARGSRRAPVVFPDIAETIVLVTSSNEGVRVESWPAAQMSLRPGSNLAGETIASLDLDKLSPAECCGTVDYAVGHGVALVASLGRSVLLLGAAERALAQTISHVQMRRQFGRTLSAFQTVQQTIAQMASLVADSSSAVSKATTSLMRVETENFDASFDVLACSLQVSRMAASVARGAHQLHGAIGFTAEHALHHATLRLSAWRLSGSAQSQTEIELGRRAFASRAPWALIVGDD